MFKLQNMAEIKIWQLDVYPCYSSLMPHKILEWLTETLKGQNVTEDDEDRVSGGIQEMTLRAEEACQRQAEGIE